MKEKCGNCKWDNICHSCQKEVAEKREYCDEYKPAYSNFDYCCENVSNMEVVMDLARLGWSNKQIIDWLLEPRSLH